MQFKLCVRNARPQLGETAKRKRKRPVRPKRYGFRLCLKPKRLGTIVGAKRIPGKPGVGIELLCWTDAGLRTYRRIRNGRRETWMVFSGFDN